MLKGMVECPNPLLSTEAKSLQLPLDRTKTINGSLMTMEIQKPLQLPEKKMDLIQTDTDPAISIHQQNLKKERLGIMTINQLMHLRISISFRIKPMHINRVF